VMKKPHEFIPKTHADYLEAKSLLVSHYRSNLKGLAYADGEECPACRGRKIARHTDVTYSEAQAKFSWATDHYNRLGLGWEALVRIPYERDKRTSIEKEPRECEACGGTGKLTRAATNAYFERHPERVCSCMPGTDHPGPFHYNDEKNGWACPLFVTYVRTEEEQLIEEITERRGLQRRREKAVNFYSPTSKEAWVRLEALFVLRQRSVDRLMEWLASDAAIVELAQWITQSGKPLDLTLAPCSYDDEALKRIARKLRWCRMMVCEFSGGIKIEAFMDPPRLTPYVARPDSAEEERMCRMTWIVNGRSGL